MSGDAVTLVTEQVDGVLIVRVTTPALNVAKAIDSMNRELAQAIKKSGIHQVLLDLADVSVISSLLLGKLIRLQKQVLGDGNLVICNLQSGKLGLSGFLCQRAVVG